MELLMQEALKAVNDSNVEYSRSLLCPVDAERLPVAA